MPHTNLAVWTSHMVMNQVAFTSFQKGVERILGRGLGIVVGLVLLTIFRNAMYLGFAFQCMAVLIFFYIFFCNRLAYTFLNAGLYLAVIMHIGRADPAAAIPEGGGLFMAILVGVLMTDLVTWFTGAERDLAIDAGGEPFLPINREHLGHSISLVATVALSQLMVTYFNLPTDATLISVMLLTIVPDMHSLLWKGELRLLGALMAIAFACCSFLILLRLPHFPILVALTFLGSYLASYLTRTGGDWSYAGLQMGLVLPMILVVPASEFGSLSVGVARVQGVVIALACAIIVTSIEAAFSRSAPSAPK